MHLGLLGASALTFAAFSAGGAYGYLQIVAPGETRNAIEFGIDNSAEVGGAAAAAPVKVIQEVKPALGAAAQEASGLAGGVANGTTPTTAAGEYGDPSEGGQG